MREVLLRQLWIEDPTEARARRCRLLLGYPVAVLVGGFYGYIASVRLGEPLLPAMATGAAVVLMILYLAGHLETLTRAVAGPERDERLGPFIEYAWDIAAGGVIGQLGVLVVGGEALVGLGLGAALGGAYSFLAGQVLCGGLAETLIGLIFGVKYGGRRTLTDHSYAASLAARGDYEAAIDVYEQYCSDHPDDPEPYLSITRILRDDLHRHDAALACLRRALATARLDEKAQVALTRQIVELCTTKLGNPLLAASDLARLAARRRGTPAGEWARSELAEIKRLIARRDA